MNTLSRFEVAAPRLCQCSQHDWTRAILDNRGGGAGAWGAHHAGSSTRTFTGVGGRTNFREHRIRVVVCHLPYEVTSRIKTGSEEEGYSKISRFSGSHTTLRKEGHLGGWGSGEEHDWCGELNHCPP
jgi:hypothetical protein